MKNALTTFIAIGTFVVLAALELNPKPAAIQLHEVVVYANPAVKTAPITLPEVVVKGKSTEIQTVKFYPAQLPVVVVLGNS